MTKQTQRAVLAVALAAMLSSAQGAAYNGDLIVGFTDSVGKDLIYDLGAAGTITNGQRWDLASRLTSFNLANVSWGVVGSSNLNAVRTGWITTQGDAPNRLPSSAGFSAVNNAISTMYFLFTNSGPGFYATIDPLDPASWNQQTINGSLTTTFHNAWQDPNNVGITCATFYSAVAQNLPPTLLGNFCLGTNGVLTFATSSIGPPAPTLEIARSGDVTTVSFLSTNSAAYTLYATNSAGLSAAIANWPVVGMTNGNNSTISLSDTSTDPDRFYQVRVE
jgi:hypothetical protein